MGLQGLGKGPDGLQDQEHDQERFYRNEADVGEWAAHRTEDMVKGGQDEAESVIADRPGSGHPDGGGCAGVGRTERETGMGRELSHREYQRELARNIFSRIVG